MLSFRNMFLLALCVVLAGCQNPYANTPNPTTFTRKHNKTPAVEWPAWLGDTNRTDVTPQDRAARLAALKTNQDGYVSIVNQAGWIAENCRQTGGQFVTTPMWQQENLAIQGDEVLQARFKVIADSHKARVTNLGGASATCQIYVGNGLRGEQIKLFLTVV